MIGFGSRGDEQGALKATFEGHAGDFDLAIESRSIDFSAQALVGQLIRLAFPTLETVVPCAGSCLRAATWAYSGQDTL